MRYSLQRRLERLAYERWTRRGLRIMLRAVWLGLAVLCTGVGLQMVLGWNLPLELLIAAALSIVAIGGALLLRRRLSADEVARRLDDRFGLHQEIATAVEVSRYDEVAGVERTLLEHANAATSHIQRQVRAAQRPPWTEIVSVVALLLVFLGLLISQQLNAPVQTSAAEPLPPLAVPPPLDDPQFPDEPPQNQEQQAGGQGGNETRTESLMAAADQQSAALIADALRDQSATRPAADALDRGDSETAAERLRELADQADQLSPETRRDLANELRDAANQIERYDPELAAEVAASASGLQQPDQSSAEAIENLADAVEGLNSRGQQANLGQPGEEQQNEENQQGEAAGGGGAGNAPPGEQREQPQPLERLGVDGVPLELDSAGSGASSDDEDPDAGDGNVGGSFEPGTGSAPDDTSVQVGEDPLRIPSDLRDVVQEYFSPNS